MDARIYARPTRFSENFPEGFIPDIAVTGIPRHKSGCACDTSALAACLEWRGVGRPLEDKDVDYLLMHAQG